MKITKQEWTKVFQSYEALAQGLVALRVMRQEKENEQPAGVFSFTRQALRWFALNP